MSQDARIRRRLRITRSRRLWNAALTVIVLAGSAGAVGYGSSLLAARAEASETFQAAALTSVAVTPIVMNDGFVIPRQFIGQVEPAATAQISFELGGLLTELAVREGQSVNEGDVIARLDTELLRAEQDRLQASRDALAARLTPAENRLRRAESLRGDGFASEAAVEEATATRDEITSGLREIDAGLRTVAINLEKSVVRAPFDGVVGAELAEGGETLGAGTPIITLIQDGPAEVRVGLPLSVDPRELEDVKIAVAGKSYPAQLSQVRPDIDPVTRTRTALFAMSASGLSFGQTATVTIPAAVEMTGTWVPLDALQEASTGVWTILVIDDEERVRAAAVEILHVDATQAYVRGTFADGAQMVATGAHRVVPGQQVRILDDRG